MAWESIGSNNDELCDKLLSHSVLKSDMTNLIEAFRKTDRGDFVLPEFR